MTKRERIDAVLRGAADAGRVPGIVAMAATDTGVIYEGAFGRRGLASGPAMTPDTVFLIASMTKAVTSVAAMQLVERGRLALDEPLGRLLPRLAAPHVLDGFDENGNPRLRPARRPITLRHLLTHTAGFGYDTWNADLARYMQRTGLPALLTGRRAALDAPLTFDPGERWQYGINTDWAGQAVEAASGQDLEAYFRAHILAPLGMRDTGFALTPDRQRRLAGTHQRQADGALEPARYERPRNPEFLAGGGGLHGTARDYLAFTRMLLNGGALDGARVLRAETIAEMARNQIGDLPAGVMKTALPQRSSDVDFFPGMAQRWGLGFLINTAPSPWGRSAGSLSWAGLHNTYFWIDPTKRVTGVILMQLLPFADEKAVAVYREFERAVYEAIGQP